MTDRELMQQALEILEKHVDYYDYEHFTSVCELEPAKDLILALRERLAQPQQWEQLYTGIGNPFKRPVVPEQRRQWQDLSDSTLEELLGLHCSTSGYMSEADAREFATDLGSRLKELNA
jgi:hypothetical protein